MWFFFQLIENGEQNSSGHLRALDSLNLLNMLFLHVVGKLLLIVEIVHSPEDVRLTDPAEDVEVLQALPRVALLQVH